MRFEFGRDPRRSGRAAARSCHFGIGMKRALFKLGDHFLIESKKPHTAEFVIGYALIDMQQANDEWKFPFAAGWCPASGQRLIPEPPLQFATSTQR